MSKTAITDATRVSQASLSVLLGFTARTCMNRWMEVYKSLMWPEGLALMFNSFFDDDAMARLRATLGDILCYDWIPIPLANTQANSLVDMYQRNLAAILTRPEKTPPVQTHVHRTLPHTVASALLSGRSETSLVGSMAGKQIPASGQEIPLPIPSEIFNATYSASRNNIRVVFKVHFMSNENMCH
ncbi:hypothetical protein RB195_002321 [Necator americanus]|uniref:Bestrophin homolog n=1 Tax=Necator americanus TaxID=51031 RepID=A0ABR1DJI8_NECAM